MSFGFRTCACLLWLLSSLAWQSILVAADSVDTQRALKSVGNAPWYDADTGSYKPPKIVPVNDEAVRELGWKSKPKQPGKAWDWSWFPDLSWLFSWFTISLLGVAIFAVLAFVLYSFGIFAPLRIKTQDTPTKIEIDQARVVDLPFEVRETSSDPLEQAELLMRAGRYSEAIAYLYGYMLLALDQTRHIELQKGKTNRMYLREIKSSQQLQNIVRTTMLIFEETYFGKQQITAVQFSNVWQQLDEFHSLLYRSNSINTSTPLIQGVTTS